MNADLDDATTPNTAYKLAAFTTFNLDANYTMPLHNAYAKQINFDLNIQNLFNLHHRTYYYQSYAELAGTYSKTSYASAYPGMPFGITFETALRF